ncbi:hypothetical protein BBJ28_00015084 [Nothophytophthora sp. Chile5]|nr:hypothetical protein BBJ28_00015084 [Nothophytophthora sp. Chile5]
MDGTHHRHRRFPRPRLGSRASRSHATASNNLVELETLSSYAALERRAVTLSEDEAQVCTRLAELLLADAVRAYESHALTGRANGSHRLLPQVDLRKWKLVKRKDQLCAYKQRKDASVASFATSTGVSPCTANDTSLPLLLVTGSLPGTVDDALFGLTSANTRAMKMNSAYAEDALEDGEVLTTLEGPTVDEPFRFLGLKWAVRRHDAASASSLLKRRDLLYLEATGATRLANGERVGYRLQHSVSVKALAQLAAASLSSTVVRARASFVQLFHQPDASASSLRVFSRGFYDPQGGLLRFLAVSAGADFLLHMSFSAVDCAHLKKLAFAAQQAGRRRRALSLQHKSRGGGMGGIEELGDEDGDSGGAARTGDLSAWAAVCSLCDRRVGRVLNRSGAPCTICAKMVCSRCSVMKKLRFSRSDDAGAGASTGVDLGGSMGVHDFERLPPEGSRTSTERSRSRSGSGSGVAGRHDICQKALKFCLPCVLRANQRSAAQIAVEELLEQTSYGLVTPHGALERPSSRSRPSSARRRSTQTGRPYSSHRISQTSVGSQPFTPHYAASPYLQPRQKAFSSPAFVPTAMRRGSRVVLYVEDARAASASGSRAA